jgi:hypothetical protein
MFGGVVQLFCILNVGSRVLRKVPFAALLIKINSIYLKILNEQL